MAQTSLALRTWVRDVAARLTAKSGVGYLATAYAVSRWLTRPTPADPDLPAELSGLWHEHLRCQTRDGLVLHGWTVSPWRPRGTVALFHGLRGHRGLMLGRIAFLLAAGYRCVAFDHRAHGRSAGRRTSFGYFEGRDVQAVADLIGRRWPDGPRAALGTSMGAAALCFAGPSGRSFDALVLESVYPDLAGAFQQRVGRGFPDWFRHFHRGIVWLTERRLAMRIEQAAPVKRIADLAPRPVLLLTGADDPHASPADVRQLAARYPGPCEFGVIPGAGHHDVAEAGGPHYRDLVLGFLHRQLAAPAQAA